MDSSGAGGRRDAHGARDAGGRDPGGRDAEPMRALVLAMLERVENFATTVIGEGVEARDPTRPPVDMGPAVRAAVDAMVIEISELVNRVLAALIAALQAISSALDEIGSERGRRAHPDARARPGRAGGTFQPITVEVRPT